MKNLEKGFIIMKVLFSLFISYLVIFKGDAGSLVNAIGNFIVAGNHILGLIYTITIYYMSIQIKKTRWTLPGALFATVAGAVASVIITEMMMG